MSEDKLKLYFQLFTEIGIVEQLSRAMLETRLPDGMLVSHFSVLNHLVRVGDGRTPQELARAFQVAKTTMTHTLAGLEAADLIETSPNPRDKRSKQIWITNAGRTFRKNAIVSMAPDVDELSCLFPPSSVEGLLPALQKLREIMDQQRDGR